MDAPLPCPAGGGAEAVTRGLVTVSLGKRPMQPADTCQGTGAYPIGPPSGVHLPTQLGCCDPQGAKSCGSPMPRGERIAKPAEWGGPRLAGFLCLMVTEHGCHHIPRLRGIMGNAVLKHWMRSGLALVAGLGVAVACGTKD